MASSNYPQFDHNRVPHLDNQNAFNGLQSESDRVDFLFMVQDYMEYIRSRPFEREGWDEAKEQRTAIRFVALINTDEVGWALAWQAVPEFQQPRRDFSSLPWPLRYIMQSVGHRLDTPSTQPPDRQHYEETAFWYKIRRQLEYLAFLAGDSRLANDERKAEVNEAMTTLTRAAAAAGGLPRIYAPFFSGGLDGNPEGVARGDRQPQSQNENDPNNPW